MKPGRRAFPPEAIQRLTTDPGPWLSCDTCFQLVDQFVESLLAGRLPATPAMLAMKAHVKGCPACAEEAESLLVLAAADAGTEPAAALRLMHDT